MATDRGAELVGGGGGGEEGDEDNGIEGSPVDVRLVDVANSISTSSLSSAAATVFEYLNACVQNMVVGPWWSQKWHNAIMAFIRPASTFLFDLIYICIYYVIDRCFSSTTHLIRLFLLRFTLPLFKFFH